MEFRAIQRALVRVSCAFVLLAGCATRTDRHEAPVAVASVPPDPAVRARAEEVAKDISATAEKTEKAEGKHDLVKDEVNVRIAPDGKPVVEQKGEASWYGRRFHGRRTASGKRFDQRGLTAAHPSLPLGTTATVTNLATGKSVVVTVTDRGPYAKGRDIDLSKAAADQLGIDDGAAPVKIDAVVTPAPVRTN